MSQSWRYVAALLVAAAARGGGAHDVVAITTRRTQQSERCAIGDGISDVIRVAAFLNKDKLRHQILPGATHPGSNLQPATLGTEPS